MRLKLDVGARLAIAELDEDETQIDFPVLDLYIRRSMEHPANLTAFELIVPAAEKSSEDLMRRHFRVTGSICVNCVTKLVLRKTLSSPAFEDTPRPVYDRAVPAPVPALTMARTREETAARADLEARMDRHYNADASARRLEAIEQDAEKFKALRNEDADIRANAERLANAITRRQEPTV
jgi:hypothetical protein